MGQHSAKGCDAAVMIGGHLKISNAGMEIRKREMRGKILAFMLQYDDLDVDTAIEVLKESAEELYCIASSMRLAALRPQILERATDFDVLKGGDTPCHS